MRSASGPSPWPWKRPESRDVETHRAVLRLGLLGEPDPARELAVRLDCPGVAVHLEVLAEPIGLVRLAPPVGHARLADEGGERLEVGLGDRPKGHALARGAPEATFASD